MDKEKADKMIERDAWNKAFQRAEGTKVSQGLCATAAPSPASPTPLPALPLSLSASLVPPTPPNLQVFDDPKLLKKKIKREERAKNKSTKLWRDREQTVSQQMKERQEKRNKNLQDRTKAKLDKRKAKAAKKRPGFVSGGVSK